MTEIFGATAGALGVAGLFNNCVTCFEYIQLSRHFGEDFERFQLKLDLARNRLGRWGEVVDVNNNPLSRAILAYDKSKRYEAGKSQESLGTLGEDDMRPLARRLHDQILARARRRQGDTNLIKKTAWALYDRKRLGQLLVEIKELVEELEGLLPAAEGTRSRLVELEVEEVRDEPGLLTLRDAASSTDELLSKAAAEKVKEFTGRNQAKDIKSQQTARVRVGNAWSDGALGSSMGIVDRTENIAGTIEATGKSIVNIGNQFGGPSN
ncbi:prion-inhibition and propagation domain-containing protein [Pochonia chlamydosporia 170]|uniref:Prion-inhibition and propagation domain-containing protein n=1 Tax=Pochonia chlamydosporia 170 TaxID=1380566 RepID=A0A179F4Q9_METCM|nr:prion-inhibition and propagation domain-containing protein [Pochonia chlamydosporia 170]OAQ60163.2 prion-inhibition and propagation domain-containing protein [Pochonia chlamydosporia 170]